MAGVDVNVNMHTFRQYYATACCSSTDTSRFVVSAFRRP